MANGESVWDVLNEAAAEVDKWPSWKQQYRVNIYEQRDVSESTIERDTRANESEANSSKST